MAVITGVTGDAVVTGNFSAIIINVSSFDMTIASDLFECGIFDVGDQTAVTNTIPQYRGLYTVSGTIRGYFPRDVGVTAAHFEVGATASTELRLTASTGRLYYGPAHLDFSFTEERVGGLVAYEAKFQSDGDWTFA